MSSTGPSPQAQAAPAAALTAGDIQQIQEWLQLLGFAPGPADGVAGARTLSAVMAFQRRIGVAPTGRLDQGLLRLLTRQVAAATAPASARLSPGDTADRRTDTTAADGAEARPVSPVPSPQGASPAAPADASETPVLIADSLWKIVDESGGHQYLRLLSGGNVGDTPTPDFWRWRIEGNRIFFEFNNLTGGWVRRSGRFTGPDRIEGSAISSRQRRWTWFAERQPQ